MYRTPSLLVAKSSVESANASHTIELLQTLIEHVSSIREEIKIVQSNFNS
jgi:hypothetical protein